MEPNNLTEQNPVNPQAPAQQQPAQPKPQANPAAAMPNAAPQPAAARPQTVQQPHPGMSQPQAQGGASKESLWYLDNYILLKDYYDRTISRIAARCVRMGNIAMEEYPFYGYILDVLEEISDTGDYILQHKELYPYVEKKIAGGLNELKKTLSEYQEELRNNSSPEMIKEDASEIEKMKEALGAVTTVADGPTLGAGMNMDQLMDKLMAQDQANKELKKVIKIKKPVNPEGGQAVPPKNEGTEE